MLKTAKRIAAKLLPNVAKHRAELSFWKDRHRIEAGDLTKNSAHFVRLYTEPFGLTTDDYNGKRVLDIGCGPRGSLEWADMTAQRVGLDPLTPEYLKLGADKQKMEYCAATSHKIPFPDGHFDVVTSLNSLDHVDDIHGTIREIKRVTKKGGLFLLEVETDHEATPTEPVTVDDGVLATLAPEFKMITEFRIGEPENHWGHTAVLNKEPPHVKGKPGWYVGKFVRQ